MKYIYILYSNISRFTHYSYIIIKRIRVSNFKIHVILFRYILHLIIIIIYKLYKNNCDFYIRPNVIVVVDNNVNVVYRISLNDWALKSVKNNYDFLEKYNQLIIKKLKNSFNYKKLIYKVSLIKSLNNK